MPFFRPLRILIHAIFHTLRSCAWALVLFTVLLYTFGVLYAQGVADYLAGDWADESEDKAILDLYFGSLPRATFTLFKSTCGGLSWHTAVMPLSNLGFFYVVLFILYISFVYFAVMNVVTGLFCQSALESTQADTANMVAEQMKLKDRYCRVLKEIVHTIDDSEDGEITIDEFESHLRDGSLWAVLNVVGIDIVDAWTLFELLDSSCEGFVTAQAFVEGCLRVKGEAKSIHIHQLLLQQDWIMEQLAHQTHVLEIHFPSFTEVEEHATSDNSTRCQSVAAVASATTFANTDTIATV